MAKLCGREIHPTIGRKWLKISWKQAKPGNTP